MDTASVFVVILNSRQFKCFEGIQTRGKTYESGDDVDVRGEAAAILGVGSTKAEAVDKGEVYYRRVCKWHGYEGASQEQFFSQHHERNENNDLDTQSSGSSTYFSEEDREVEQEEGTQSTE